MENPSSGPGFPSWYRFNEMSRCYFFFFAAFFLAFFLAGIQSHLQSVVRVHGFRVEQKSPRVKRKVQNISIIFLPPFIVTHAFMLIHEPCVVDLRSPPRGAMCRRTHQTLRSNSSLSCSKTIVIASALHLHCAPLGDRVLQSFNASNRVHASHAIASPG